MCSSESKLYKRSEAECLIRQPNISAHVKIVHVTRSTFTINELDARRFREAEFPGFSKARIINQVIYNMMRFEQSDTSIFCQGVIHITEQEITQPSSKVTTPFYGGKTDEKT
jgi:hypothetical protein